MILEQFFYGLPPYSIIFGNSGCHFFGGKCRKISLIICVCEHVCTCVQENMCLYVWVDVCVCNMCISVCEDGRIWCKRCAVACLHMCVHTCAPVYTRIHIHVLCVCFSKIYPGQASPTLWLNSPGLTVALLSPSELSFRRERTSQEAENLLDFSRVFSVYLERKGQEEKLTAMWSRETDSQFPSITVGFMTIARRPDATCRFREEHRKDGLGKQVSPNVCFPQGGSGY